MLWSVPAPDELFVTVLMFTSVGVAASLHLPCEVDVTVLQVSWYAMTLSAIGNQSQVNVPIDSACAAASDVNTHRQGVMTNREASDLFVSKRYELVYRANAPPPPVRSVAVPPLSYCIQFVPVL